MPAVFVILEGAKLVLAAVRKFKEISNNIQNRIKDLYYRYIAPQVSGEYEVETYRLSQCAIDMREKAKELTSYKNDVGEIRRNLRFEATSGAYYKSKLLIFEWNLQSDIKNLQKLADKAERYADMYVTTDDKVSEYY